MLFTEKSRTKQSFKNECNINKIMAKYEHGQLITHVNNRAAQYADVTNLPDYQEALNKIEFAQILFDELPAKVRKEFDNDPAAFCDFVSNPQNIEKISELGLTEKRTEAIAPEPIPTAGVISKDPADEVTQPE